MQTPNVDAQTKRTLHMKINEANQKLWNDFWLLGPYRHSSHKFYRKKKL